ncbi:MAG: efflux RND transporter periplasmic adaptor subunit [Alphaproteobacteria bacterium]|nr:efflux RND transporter periplasmic adaptor subunit [Alphaproteobacteria bacterium]
MNQKQLRPYLYTISGVLGVIVLGVFLRQCNKKSEVESFDRIKYVEVTPVKSGQLLRKINAIGKLAANQSVVVKTEMPGRVAKIHFKDGQAVKQGDPLIEFDSEQLRLEAEQARAKASQYSQLYQRSSELFQKKLISSSEFEKAKAEYEQTRAQAAEKDLLVRKSIIRAPFEGVLGIREKDISPGAYVNQNHEIVSLVDIDPMLVDFNVSGAYTASLKEGQEIQISVDGTSLDGLSAQIDAVDARVDEAGNTLRVRGSVPNKSGALKPGMFAKVLVVIGEVSNAIQVPEGAVERNGNQSYVYRVTKIQSNVGYAALTPVVIGTRQNGMVEIMKGLEAKDVVVTGGLTGLHDGQEVRIQKTVAAEDVAPKPAAENVASEVPSQE